MEVLAIKTRRVANPNIRKPSVTATLTQGKVATVDDEFGEWLIQNRYATAMAAPEPEDAGPVVKAEDTKPEKKAEGSKRGILRKRGGKKD